MKTKYAVLIGLIVASSLVALVMSSMIQLLRPGKRIAIKNGNRNGLSATTKIKAPQLKQEQAEREEEIRRKKKKRGNCK
ncbi:hypothetical protein [Klebsiella oxytoca]|uniref:hypothetical protein n=1 Tax=Klebsiella oxytoca TaxID=571 RepID=UPI001D18C83E|nr:hypothetical protein [Klebsiella oxytoca]